MKFVVDTNVLVSGSLWPGNPARLLDALLDGSATLCLSAALLAEFEEVLGREKFRKRLEDRGRTASELVSRFRAAAWMAEGSPIAVPPALRDPDDAIVLACSKWSNADAIVTGDMDLISLQSFQSIPILTVSQALEKLGITPI